MNPSHDLRDRIARELNVDAEAISVDFRDLNNEGLEVNVHFRAGAIMRSPIKFDYETVSESHQSDMAVLLADALRRKMWAIK